MVCARKTNIEDYICDNCIPARDHSIAYLASRIISKDVRKPKIIRDREKKNGWTR